MRRDSVSCRVSHFDSNCMKEMKVWGINEKLQYKGHSRESH